MRVTTQEELKKIVRHAAERVSLSIHPRNKIRKNKSHKSDSYLTYIRGLKCLVCGKSEVDPHHMWCAKENDFLAVPLCRIHHQEIHAAPNSFPKCFDIYFEHEIIELLTNFIREKL